MSEPIQAQVTAIGEVMNAKIAELQVALTLATKRAEKAEAHALGCAMECSKAVDRAMKFKAECDALLGVIEQVRPSVTSEALLGLIDAALAVQP